MSDIELFVVQDEETRDWRMTLRKDKTAVRKAWYNNGGMQRGLTRKKVGGLFLETIAEMWKS